jgi:hypothetical protein
VDLATVVISISAVVIPDYRESGQDDSELNLVPKSQMFCPARFGQVKQTTSEAVQSGFQQLAKSIVLCHPLHPIVLPIE